MTELVLDNPATTMPPQQIVVREMQERDMAQWDAFVACCPQATFFHRAGWKTAIETAFRHKTWFLMALADGQIQGILPLAQIKSRLFGNTLCSLPFCVYGGIAALSNDARDALDQAAQQLAAKLKVGHLEYRNVAPCHADWHTKSLYVTFRKAIDPDVDANMQAIPRKQRAMVRKGIKAGLQGSEDTDVERFFAAYSASVHRLGTPVFPKRFFKILKQVFGNDCRILTITRDDRIVASVMSFYFRDEVLPYYGGGNAEAREVAGNDFMYWELMRRSCEEGYKIFDFGRSKIGTGSFDFKKNWGFEAQPLHYECQLHAATAVPDTNPLNPKYQLFIKGWQRLPLPVANMLGPLLARNLG